MSVLRDGINTRFPTTRWQGSLRSQLRPMGCEHRPLQDWWPQVYLAQARETWRYHVTEYLHTYTYTSFCRAISKSISYPHMILDHIYMYIYTQSMLDMLDMQCLLYVVRSIISSCFIFQL